MRWLVLHTTVIAVWMWAHASVGAWLMRAWLSNEGQLHLVLAIALLLGAASRVDPVRLLDRLALPPRWSWLALGLAAGPPVLAAAVQRSLPLETIAAAAAVVSAYGLAGLFGTADGWRRLRPAAALGALLLPLSGQLDVLLGYPLRLATASLVAMILGPAEVTAGTVLAVDGAFAHVDLPCSGVQSLWSGMVVLLGAAVLWRRPVGLRFAGVATAVVGLLVLANTLRVFVLVSVTHLLQWPLVADVLHMPLGVVGFVGAVIPGLLALRVQAEIPPTDDAVPSASSRWATVAVGAAIVGTLLLQRMPVHPRTVASHPVAMPNGMVPLVPAPQEAAFAAEHGAQVLKARFERSEVHGTVVMVSSHSWLAHHVPTWCLQSGGWTLSAERPVHVDGTVVRWAEAQHQDTTATAVWWFESADRQTDDHTVRIWRGLMDDEPWVLVSVLIDGSADPGSDLVHGLIEDLRASVAQTLEDA